VSASPLLAARNDDKASGVEALSFLHVEFMRPRRRPAFWRMQSGLSRVVFFAIAAMLKARMRFSSCF
jgi:hypothetical protein